MPSNSEAFKSSTTTLPFIGSESKESQSSASLTVELSDSATEIFSSDLITSSMTAAMSPDATVIRNRNERSKDSGEHSSKVNSISTNSFNANVDIVQDDINESQSAAKIQLGDYQLERRIGGGGMGVVYLATDVHLDRKIALKILPPNQQSEEFRERFIVEAKASAKLHHENIVTVYSFGETNGLMYLAMEYIPGDNLRDIVTKNGTLSVEDALSYAIQMASALEHIYENGIVHRDIKPSNVLITGAGIVKVIDLGLAKNFDDSSKELTRTGVTLGTFDYISPEQARNSRNVDIRADIYSLGCSLFFMLAGQPPFPSKNVLEKLLNHQDNAPPNIQDFRSDVPDRLAEIINCCMEKDAAKRYQTPQALSKALYIAAEELGMRPSGISLSKWYLPSKSQLRIWKDRLSWAIPIVVLLFSIMILDRIWKTDQRQAEFLPESPGLKQSIASVDADRSAAPRSGLPIKKVKPLRFNYDPKSFPQPPEELTAPQNEPVQPTVQIEEPTKPVDDGSSSGDQPVYPSPAAASNNQPIRESAPAQERTFPQTPSSSIQKNIIHSVRLETD